MNARGMGGEQKSQQEGGFCPAASSAIQVDGESGRNGHGDPLCTVLAHGRVWWPTNHLDWAYFSINAVSKDSLTLEKRTRFLSILFMCIFCQVVEWESIGKELWSCMKQLVQTVTSLTVMNFYHFDSMFELAILYLNKMSEQMKLHVDLLSVILVLQQVCFFGGWGYGGNFSIWFWGCYI